MPISQFYSSTPSGTRSGTSSSLRYKGVFKLKRVKTNYQHSRDIKADVLKAVMLKKMAFSKRHHLYELKRQVRWIENWFYPNNLMAQLPHFMVASSPGHTEIELSHKTNLD